MYRYPNNQQSYGDTRITNHEGLESYFVKHVIGRGSYSVVHLATCTRGRLRGRDVALKFVFLPLPTPFLESARVTTTALHKSLHHPAVVAIHSEFTTADYHCVVLELCEGGNLWNFLHSPPKDSSGEAEPESSERILNEMQLRPMMRSMIEALSHLHTRGIAHQALSAHNVFLTADGRTKLGGFGHSSVFSIRSKESRSNVSEEIRSEMKTIIEGQCGVHEDVWSLGRLALTLLTGRPPSEAGNGTMCFTHISSPPRILPTKLKCSKEAEALITTLLTYNPDEQSPLVNILSQPFFDHTQKIEFLNTGFSVVSKVSREDNIPPVRRDIQVYVDAQSIQQKTLPLRKMQDLDRNDTQHQKRNNKPRLPYRMPANLVTSKGVANPTLPGGACTDSCPQLPSGSSTAAGSGIRDAWTKLTTRQKPIGVDDNRALAVAPESPGDNEGTLTSSHPEKERRKALAEVGNYRLPSTPGEKHVEIKSTHVTASGLLSPPETHCSGHFGGESDIPAQFLAPLSPLASPLGSIPVSESDKSIPRTNFPTAFTVPPLFPQTHKLGHGQLVVQPSRSLLVDLREGERRAGGRGDRVLCVSADGQEIRVYDAPHLSTPCILSEPIATWTLSSLPTEYWESYILAGKFIESAKKRTPLMVWYTAQAKITLMSNGPQGDVHAAFPCPSPGAQRRRRTDCTTKAATLMRIVLSRVRGTVEVARFTSGEWVSKKGPHPAKTSDMGLTEEERAGLECVLAALAVCEAAEAQCVPTGSTESKRQKHQEPEKTEDQLFVENAGNRTALRPKGEVTLTTRQPLIIAPRPRRVSSAITRASRGGVRFVSDED